MALTQEQWYRKLRSWVPAWMFEQERYNVAVFRAMAKVLSTLQEDAESLINETFISVASDPVLDAHGDERSTDRLEGEADSTYSVRVRNIINSSDKASIKAIVDGLLHVGTCEIREGIDAANPYLSRKSFLNRDGFLNDYHYNVFTILVDRQLRAADIYASRGVYLSRSSFLKGADAVNNVYEVIEEAVNAAKALGVLYKIVERN